MKVHRVRARIGILYAQHISRYNTLISSQVHSPKPAETLMEVGRYEFHSLGRCMPNKLDPSCLTCQAQRYKKNLGLSPPLPRALKPLASRHQNESLTSSRCFESPGFRVRGRGVSCFCTTVAMITPGIRPYTLNIDGNFMLVARGARPIVISGDNFSQPISVLGPAAFWLVPG
jgi:hypothetical protein